MPKTIQILLLGYPAKDAAVLENALINGGLIYELKHSGSQDDFERVLHEFSPHVVISDTLFGLEACHLTRKLCSHIPLLMLSDPIGEEKAVKFMKAGAADYLLKENIHQLVRKIESAIKEQQKRNRAGQTLHKEKKTLIDQNAQDILESISDGFFAVDKKWRITYWNREAERLMGVRREDLLEKNLWEVFADAIDLKFYSECHNALADSKQVHFEEFFPFLKTWIEVNAYPSQTGLAVYFKDITPKVTAEQLLRKSEERRKLIMNASIDAVIAMDTAGDIIDWNAQAEEIFGWTADEAVGQKLSGLIIPEQFRKSHEIGIEEFLRTGKGTLLNNLIVVQAVNKKKVLFPVELRIVYVNGVGNDFFCGFLRDISQRKKAEHKLLKSELGLQQAQALAHVGSWEHDMASDTSYWSDETFRILGFKPGEVVPSRQTFLSRVHPDDMEKVKLAMEATDNRPADRTYVTRIVWVNGTIRTIFCDRQYEVNQEGELTGIHGIFRDITKEQQREEELLAKSLELHTSEQKYRQLFHQNPLPMWVYDPQSLRFLDVNEAAIRHYGYNREEFLSMTIQQIRPREEWHRVEKSVITVRKRKGFYNGVYQHLKKTGELMQVQVQSNVINFQGISARLVLAIDVTKRYEAEQNLLRSEKRFKALVQDSADLVAILNQNGVYQYINPRIERLLGWRPADLKDKNALNLVHPEDRVRVFNQLQALYTKKRVTLAPYRYKNASNEWRWLQTTATNLTNTPAIEGVVTNSRDITETHLVQQEIKKIKETYEAITQATSDAVYESNFLTQTVQLIGKGFRNLFGYDLENCEISVEFMSNLLHPDDRSQVFELYEQAWLTPGQKLWSVECRFLKADGSYTYVLNRFSVVFENGAPLKILGITKDIAEQKAAEQRLANSEKRFRALIENSTDGLTLISRDKIVLDVSPSGKRILGYEKESYIGHDRSELVHPDDRQLVEECFAAVLQNPDDVRMITYRFRKANGAYIWIESTFHNQLSDPNIDAVVLNYRDISERKKQEQEREQLIEELTRNFNDLQQFSFITSHNLRAPLSNLTGILQLMDTAGTKDEETLNYIRMFHASTHQLNDTVNDLVKILVIKQNPQIGKVAISLNEKWTSVQKMVSGDLHKIDPVIKVSFEEAPFVYFNPAYLESILLNLLVNSLKYRSLYRRLTLNLRSWNEKDYVVLSFSDNGTGIDTKRHADRIFGLYQRFHSNTEGKGIGLYMVQSQVTSLGGKIEIEGQVDKGLLFRIFFKKEGADAK